MSFSSPSQIGFWNRLVITTAILFLGTLVPFRFAGAQPPTLLEWSEDGLGIVLDSNSSSEAQVTINIGDGSLRATFAVDNPSRIVLDLTKVSLKGSRSVKVPRPALIRGIRLGVHKDQVRVVLDCEGDRSPKFTVEGSTGAIKVTLRALPGAKPGVEESLPLPTVPPTEIARNETEKEPVAGGGSSPVTIPTIIQDLSHKSSIQDGSVSSEPSSSSSLSVEASGTEPTPAAIWLPNMSAIMGALPR